MAYKDKDRQKQAVKDAVKRHRQKGITYKQRQGITQPETVIPSVIPDEGMLKPGQTAYDPGRQGSTKGITHKARTVTPSVPTLGTLTKEEMASYVKGLSATEAKAILDGWADGHGTEYQQRLALLGQAYSQNR